MARKVDLTGENITRRRRKDRNYGTKTDLSSTVVERGSTHWAEGSNVHIDGLLGVAGTATVSGVLSVTGTLNASGQINLSGSTAITGPLNVTGTTTIGGNTNITGELNVTGPTTLDGILDIGGDTTISGTLDIQGETTLNSDLSVVNNGKIKVGTNMTLTPADNGGSIVFQDGSKVTSVGGTVQAQSSGAGGVTAGLNSASISTGNALISVDDLGDWSLSGANVTFQTIGGTADLNGNLDVSGNITHPGIEVIGTKVRITEPYEGGQQPNVYMSEAGFLYRTNWTPA